MRQINGNSEARSENQNRSGNRTSHVKDPDIKLQSGMGQIYEITLRFDALVWSSSEMSSLVTIAEVCVDIMMDSVISEKSPR